MKPVEVARQLLRVTLLWMRARLLALKKRLINKLVSL